MRCARCNGTGWERDYSCCLACGGTCHVTGVTRNIQTETVQPIQYLTERQRDNLRALADQLDTKVCFHDRPDIGRGTTLIHFADYEFTTEGYVRAVITLKRMDSEELMRTSWVC